MKEELIYLNRIIWIINDLEKYLWDDDLESFYKNEMKIDACLMKLQVLWETIKKIWNYPEIPYKQIIWFRDYISHDYFWLDDDIIWETLKSDIPELKKIIEKIILEKFN